jgi:hypothetical protein
MATETQKARLRADLDLPIDADVDDLFAEAEETYAPDSKLAYKLARLIGCDRLLMQAAKEVDYQANESQEKASQRFAHLKAMRGIWEADLTAAAANAKASMRVMRMNRKPKRTMEFPDA